MLSPYLDRSIADGSFVAWVCELDGEVIGTGGVVVYERPAWRGVVAREGCVLNMYTVPAHRRHGVGTAIMEAIIAFAGETDLRLWLLATEDGRPIYERLGFRPDPRFMRWP